MNPSGSLAGNLYVLDDRDPRCLVLGVMEDFVGGIVGRNGATISEIQSVSYFIWELQATLLNAAISNRGPPKNIRLCLMVTG